MPTVIQRSLSYVDSATPDHFTQVLATGASEFENLSIGGATVGTVPITIGMIRLTSAENLDWDVVFFSNVAPSTTGVLASGFRVLDFWPFVAADAVRFAGQGYIYGVTGLEIQYRDADNLGQLHVGLYNRSTASKTAGAAGFVQLRIGFHAEASG